MKLLVTGGLGFIGSHTVVELMKNHHEVIIVDNLSNAEIRVLDNIIRITGKAPVFYQRDVTEETALEEIFREHKIHGVLHFAGYKAVAESVENPLSYYYNNILSTMLLTKFCIRYEVKKFVFSSSATVYGNQPSPLREDMERGKTTNPYGETKAMSERILRDVAKAEPSFSVSLLRYFNPIGAHPTGLIGESPKGIPNNLMPFLLQVAKGEREKLFIFGKDYPTKDGTGIRDYIHVVDLARGHVKAIEKDKKGVEIYNLGVGRGVSVLELVEYFQKVTGISIPYEFVERRQGDVAVSYADVKKAEKELCWQGELTLEDMIRDAWNYQKMV